MKALREFLTIMLVPITDFLTKRHGLPSTLSKEQQAEWDEYDAQQWQASYALKE
ncbi:hypothetical protein [Hymenobacter sp. YC55]|uniref:hypothetical protein n=1 Tax=Hymenobacter sp. YC55 TaxID=3034019 RepID=UPI0023F86428|nr:hypothetical protein [Hymenobacter sp. YC55]MDF7810653.1 hypothetical protein [Hymenobacter sp. YC55]